MLLRQQHICYVTDKNSLEDALHQMLVWQHLFRALFPRLIHLYICTYGPIKPNSLISL